MKTRHSHSQCHAKQHLNAISNAEIHEQIKSLKNDWRTCNYVERGDRLIMLVSAGCTVRGLARDLGLDDGSIRRAIAIAKLPEQARKKIQSGANPRPYLRGKRGLVLNEEANRRLEHERLDGTSSSELADKMTWFALTEFPDLCRGGYVELFLEEVAGELDVRPFLSSKARPVIMPKPVDPAYPLRRVIEMARPKPDPDWIPFETAIQWMVNLILMLEPLKSVRNAAILKMKQVILRLEPLTTDIQKVAKSLTPSALAALLAKSRPEKPRCSSHPGLLPYPQK